jgi:hypothetical protein
MEVRLVRDLRVDLDAGEARHDVLLDGLEGRL